MEGGGRKEAFKDRTKRLGVDVIKFVDRLPQTAAGRVVTTQLVRCGTSVGANYRAACRARSDAECLAKLGIVEEEADEVCFWLEIAIDAHLVTRDVANPLIQEANEITAIVVTSIRNLRKRISGEK